MGPAHHVPGHAGVHPAVSLLHLLDGVDIGEARGGGSLKQEREFVSGAHIITGIMPAQIERPLLDVNLFKGKLWL